MEFLKEFYNEFLNDYNAAILKKFFETTDKKSREELLKLFKENNNKIIKGTI